MRLNQNLFKKKKEAKKPWVSTQSSKLENYNTWRNATELGDASLVNDKINNIEQMCVKADAASKRKNTKELFNIVKKLNGDQKHHHYLWTNEMGNLQPHLLSY